MDPIIKQAKYLRLKKQLQELFLKTENKTARMVTTIAILHSKINYFFWTGFYFFDNNTLTVGPYQGSLACLTLAKDKGICWAAIRQRKSILVPDTDKFPGHIACDSRSKSELVVPIFDNNHNVIGVFDIDSKSLNSFDKIDQKELEDIVSMIFNN